MKAYLHHLRGTLPPAEDIQREPVSVIRSIPIRDIVTAFIVFGALAFVAGGVMAMGGGQ